MDIELLAKKMRDAALSLEQEMESAALDQRRARQQQLDELKKLYFNAGRWAGGARDRTAKEAFQRVSLGE